MGLSLSKVFWKREVRIVLVGLDCVGKTTILYKLKLGQIVSTTPTIGKYCTVPTIRAILQFQFLLQLHIYKKKKRILAVAK